MKNLLTVQNLSKTFISRKASKKITVNAVCDVTFSLAPGENLGIIGASGCGKTTLLKMILGLTQPTSGAVTKNAAAGFVSQDPYSSLCRALTVAEIVAEPLIFGGKCHRAPQCKSEVSQVLEGVQLPYHIYADRYPIQLSGGERQRVSIARAMIANPGFLVLDEPTSMIDFELKTDIMRIIKDMTASFGTSILLVTHDITVARDLCGTLSVMNAGRILETNTADAIVTNPQHEYTKRLITAGSDLAAYWELRAEEDMPPYIVHHSA